MKYARHIAWIVLATLFLLPVLWMVMSSFKTSNIAIFERPFALPAQITFANYTKAVREGTWVLTSLTRFG
jgi:ABC-type glycerol-3-phosphate transport system permease component